MLSLSYYYTIVGDNNEPGRLINFVPSCYLVEEVNRSCIIALYRPLSLGKNFPWACLVLPVSPMLVIVLKGTKSTINNRKKAHENINVKFSC